MTNEELIKKLEEYDIEVNKLFQENEKLKSRIDKAREYIKEHKFTNPHLASLLVDSEITELEKILKGEENDR